METIALKGKMGSHNYYSIKMKAGELVKRLGFPDEITEWTDFTLEEQKALNLNPRDIAKTLVPLFLENPEKFLGTSFVVDVYTEIETLNYTTLHQKMALPQGIVRQFKDSLGFLECSDSSKWIALEHLPVLLALRLLIQGWRGWYPDTVTLPADLQETLIPHPEFEDYEFELILIPHSHALRDVFRHLHRCVHNVSRGAVILSKDDPETQIALRIMGPSHALAPIKGKPLVNYKSNTLAQRSIQFITISNLKRFIALIGEDLEFSSQELVSTVDDIWTTILAWDEFQFYIRCLKGEEDQTPAEARQRSVLFQPILYLALAHTANLLLKRKMPLKDSLNQIYQKVNWENYVSTLDSSKSRDASYIDRLGEFILSAIIEVPGACNLEPVDLKKYKKSKSEKFIKH